MAGGFVDSLVIGIGLDTSQIAEGVQKVGAQLDSGLSAAAQSAASKMSPLGEALKSLATQAEGVKSAIENVAKGATPLGEALKNFGKDAEDRALKALNDLGIRSTEQIQQKIA